jgi:pilus assembly protein CpaB
MDKRFISVLIFAFFMSTLASTTLYRLTTNRSQPAHAALPTVKVVVASHDLELGTIIGESDLVLKDGLGEKPAGASSYMQDFIGRGVTTKIYAKEAILDSRLALKGAGGGFAAMIPTGMRAAAVPVNPVAADAGFVLPGMHVDVLISGTPPNGTRGLGTQARTLLQNIEVLSAGQDLKKDAEGKPVAVQVVNLLVTPEQAEQLSLASHQTTIQLVLRNPLDQDITSTPAVAVEQLFGADKPRSVEARALAVPSRARRPAKPAAVVATPPPPSPVKEEDSATVEIILGSKKSETKFGQ